MQERRWRVLPSFCRPRPKTNVHHFVLLVGACLAAMILSPHGHAQGSPSEPRYGRDIRPILSDRCFKCHGPDAKQRQADLRLDARDSAIASRSGVAAIVPGAPAESELLRRVESTDPNEQMPPPEAHKRALNAEEIELLRQWIQNGAPYEDHWAFLVPAKAELPAVENEAWCSNPIDRFVLAELERRGLEPSAPAAPEVAIRRLFLDLTGLPPTPEEIDDFLADPSSAGWSAWVSKLREEEPYRSRYAEHMASRWLDLARYADTCGIHMDAGRQIWPYRDWVLQAFRDDLPFDQFIVDQVAGDLVPDGTLEQKIATGFLRAHVTTDEGGAINEEYLVEYAADRAATVSSVFLGLTMACARCHDHKYDPLTQEDFYSMFAFFNSNEEPGLYSQSPDPMRAHEPFLLVPNADQQRAAEALRGEIENARRELALESPQDRTERENFLRSMPEQAGVDWAKVETISARSDAGASTTIEADGSVYFHGENPATDEHVIELRTERRDLRLIALEAMADARLPQGRVGRAPNGNAVLGRVQLEVRSLKHPDQSEVVKLVWAWADHEQQNGDYQAIHVLDDDAATGWAVDGHGRAGNRVLLLLAEKPFGFAGGSSLQVRLQYGTPYANHVLGRVAIHLATLSAQGLAMLPTGRSGWYRVGPFPHADREAVFDTAFGPERDPLGDLGARYGDEKKLSWKRELNLRDGENFALESGQIATYIAMRMMAPTDRRVALSLGSDDGFRLFLDGEEQAQRRVDRGVQPDQDQASLTMRAGSHWLVMKIVNTGGVSGVNFRMLPRGGELANDLVLVLLPERVRKGMYDDRLAEAWKLSFSARHADARLRLDTGERDLAALEQRFNRTMVMKERMEPRPTFVLTRGAYDQPDRSRPVARAVPAALGQLPAGAPADRLGLALWLVDEQNPLVARVTVNRLWEWVFGQGLVRTSEDFGYQGEWPSHPALLDWLAMELVDSGWRISHVLDLMLTSSTYLQSSARRAELDRIDSENLLLGRALRQRLSAEVIRDQALYLSGLLVERFGGPSVKPYQPEGLWQEVAMLQSNTRIFKRDDGDALWRRSLYTYWKRACPPPALMAFDAPTREFCTTRRSITNTPLQALVLWNDEQHVEAARKLAEMILYLPGDQQRRLRLLYRRTTGRQPDASTLERLARSLEYFRARYAAEPADATRLVEVGTAPRDEERSAVELAAWTLIASACLNLDTTISRN